MKNIIGAVLMVLITGQVAFAASKAPKSGAPRNFVSNNVRFDVADGSFLDGPQWSTSIDGNNVAVDDATNAKLGEIYKQVNGYAMKKNCTFPSVALVPTAGSGTLARGTFTGMTGKAYSQDVATFDRVDKIALPANWRAKCKPINLR